MDQIRQIFGRLSLTQRIAIAAAAILVICSVVFFLRWNREKDFKPIYEQLSSEDSGAVIAKLRESATEYRLRPEDSAILVPSAKVAELRLQMATSGIPKSGRIGYELFDKTNLGTTDFAEQVNYHRAVEGELERSVMAMAEVEQARVHITFPKESVFTDNKQPAKASVMVKLKTGAQLSEHNASAISQLMASAVEGLTPEGVSVMDMKGNLLIRPRKPGDGSEPSDDLLLYKGKLESETLAKITSVLDPLLGSAKYRASVDMDCDLTSGEQSEETYDPNQSIITTSQKTEEGSVAHDTAGVPGTASNLPRPTSHPQTGGAGIARRTESTNYETSRTVRRLKLPQGIVKRMSLSVLVDQDVHWEMAGKGAAAHPQKTIEAPSAARMKSIQAVVAAAAGFNATRGDLLTVETLPFEATLNAEPPASLRPVPAPDKTTPPKFSTPLIGGIAGGVVLLLVAVLFAARSMKKARAGKQAQLAAATETVGSHGNAEHLPESAQLSAGAQKAADVLAAITGQAQSAPAIAGSNAELLTKQLIEEAKKDPAALAQIVRTWLNESQQS